MDNSKPDTAHEIFPDLKKFKTHERLASDPDTPEHILKMLSTDKNKTIRYWVSQNDATPADTLATLAADSSVLVRKAAAAHKNTSVNTLTHLANDPSWEVREQVAANLKTPDSVLSTLMSQDSDICWKIHHNPNVSDETLTKLVTLGSEHYRWKVAADETTQKDILTLLASDPSVQVRYKVAYNTNTPVSILMKLAKDTNPGVPYWVALNNNTTVDILKMVATANSSVEIHTVVEKKRLQNLENYIETLPEDLKKITDLLLPTFTGWAEDLAGVLQNLSYSNTSKKHAVTITH